MKSILNRSFLVSSIIIFVCTWIFMNCITLTMGVIAHEKGLTVSPWRNADYLMPGYKLGWLMDDSFDERLP